MSFPNGYTCASCGAFVGWNISHHCAGMAARSSAAVGMPTAEQASLARIGAALERIAAALEDRTTTGHSCANTAPIGDEAERAWKQRTAQ